ncbi:MAG: glycosyltransferase family 2 protein [Lysobacter sp.]
MMSESLDQPKVAVVIPSFKVVRHITALLAAIGPEVWRIFVVDDACPEGSGRLVQAECRDDRVHVIYHETNLGVGGAVMTGYVAAIRAGADIIVKLDGDGQMDPSLLPTLVMPIAEGHADYTKGNRFFDLAQIGRMPPVRVFGNAMLSFMSKFSCGYWNIFDPTNGYTAIHVKVAAILPLDKISRRYFFETDILFRLNTFRAVVVDVPMDALYGNEVSGLKISKVVGEFTSKHIQNLCKRIVYNYLLRDLSIASIELLVGLTLLLFGAIYGGLHWYGSSISGVPAPLGTVIVAALSILLGIQLVLAFLAFDIASVPVSPIHPRLRRPTGRVTP